MKLFLNLLILRFAAFLANCKQQIAKFTMQGFSSLSLFYLGVFSVTFFKNDVYM